MIPVFTHSSENSHLFISAFCFLPSALTSIALCAFALFSVVLLCFEYFTYVVFNVLSIVTGHVVQVQSESAICFLLFSFMHTLFCFSLICQLMANCDHHFDKCNCSLLNFNTARAGTLFHHTLIYFSC